MIRRLKLQIGANRYRVVAAALLLGVVFLLYAGHVYANPTVVDLPPEQEDDFAITAELEHHTVVEEDTPLYERGEVLELQPAYIINATPSITIESTIHTPEDREVEITQRLLLVERATRDGNEFWNRQRMLSSDHQVVENETLGLSAEIDVNSLRRDQIEIEDTIAAAGSPRTTVLLEVEYSAPGADNETREGELVVEPNLQIIQNAFWFDGELDDEMVETKTVLRGQEERPPNMGFVLLLGFIGGTLVVGGVGVGIVSRDYDVEKLQQTVHHEEYSDWISEGDIIADSESQYIYVNSVEDLVNVGIDADKRVIYDSGLEIYMVADGDYVYYFAKDATNIEQWMEI